MKLKGSKKNVGRAIFCLVLFMVGFMAAKIAAFPQTDGSDDSIARTSSPGNGEPTGEKREVNYTATFIIFSLIVAVLGYGYYKERKNNF